MIEDFEQGEAIGAFDHEMVLDGEPTKLLVEIRQGNFGYEVRAYHLGCLVPLDDAEHDLLREIAGEIYG